MVVMGLAGTYSDGLQLLAQGLEALLEHLPIGTAAMQAEDLQLARHAPCSHAAGCYCSSSCCSAAGVLGCTACAACTAHFAQCLESIHQGCCGIQPLEHEVCGSRPSTPFPRVRVSFQQHNAAQTLDDTL